MFRFALVGVAAATINLDISDCGDSSTHGHVSGISPTSVQQGQKTVVSGSGHLDTTAADGSFDVKVKAAGVTMQSCSGNLCGASKCALPAGTGSVDFHGAACPLQAGDITLDFDVQVSRFVPSSLAHLDIEITSEGSAGKLLCAKITTSPGLAMNDDAWDNFKNTYGKVYNGADHEAEHRQVYEANMAANAAHNALNLPWTQGENQFSDLTQDQFRVAAGLGWQPAPEEGTMPLLRQHVHNGEELADSVDWTTQGAVTPVKDQGQCGSCWSFGTTGGIEGSWQIASGSLKSLSEQQLVDCSRFPNMGCNGGNPQIAVGFETNHNVCSESSYPYTASKGSCKGDTTCTAAIPKGGVTGYNKVGGLFGANKNDMMSAVQQQPVTIAIQADQASFQHYTGGVLTADCGTQLDHAVLTVGYGTDSGNDYWLVKNSWGTSWGDAGYIKIGSATNLCGVLNQAGYPSVSASVAV